MSSFEKTPKDHAVLAGFGATVGIGTAMAGMPVQHLHKVGVAGPVNTFTNATTTALRHHASVVSALGAGATAVVGGPAVVAAATAAAPFVAAAGALALTAFGLFKLYEALTEK